MGPGIFKNNVKVDLPNLHGPVIQRTPSKFEQICILMAELRDFVETHGSKGIKVKQETVGLNTYELKIELNLKNRADLPISPELSAVLNNSDYKGNRLSLTMFDRNGKLMGVEAKQAWFASLS